MSSTRPPHAGQETVSPVGSPRWAQGNGSRFGGFVMRRVLLVGALVGFGFCLGFVVRDGREPAPAGPTVDGAGVRTLRVVKPGPDGRQEAVTLDVVRTHTKDGVPYDATEKGKAYEGYWLVALGTEPNSTSFLAVPRE